MYVAHYGCVPCRGFFNSMRSVGGLSTEDYISILQGHLEWGLPGRMIGPRRLFTVGHEDHLFVLKLLFPVDSQPRQNKGARAWQNQQNDRAPHVILLVLSCCGSVVGHLQFLMMLCYLSRLMRKGTLTLRVSCTAIKWSWIFVSLSKASTGSLYCVNVANSEGSGETALLRGRAGSPERLLFAYSISYELAHLLVHMSHDMTKQTNWVCAHRRLGERGGSVVECRTPEREVRGSRPTAAVLFPWVRHFTPRKYWFNYPGSDGSVPTWLKNCWLGR